MLDANLGSLTIGTDVRPKDGRTWGTSDYGVISHTVPSKS